MSKNNIDQRYIKKILLIRMDALGDSILTTPLINTLHKNWPGVTIDVLSTPYTRQFFSQVPGVNRVIPFRGGKILDNYAFFRKVAHEFHDLVLAASPTQNTYLASRLSRSPYRVGIIYQERPLVALAQSLYNIFTHPVYASPREAMSKGKPSPHEVEQVLSLCGPLGITDLDRHLSFVPNDDEIFEARQLFEQWGFSEIPVFCVHLSQKWIQDSWEESHIVQLVESILKALGNGGILITHGPGEKALGAGMEKAFAHQPLIRCRGDMSVGLWASLIKLCRGVITPDTSAIHVGSAMGVPVAVIYSPHDFLMNSTKFAPWQVPKLIIKRGDPATDIQKISRWTEKTTQWKK